MRHGAGPGRTRADHLDVAAQAIAALAAARRAGELAELIGTAALSAADRRYQDFETAFETRLMNQGRRENRTLGQTLGLAWQALAVLPRRELTMLPAEALDAYYPAASGSDDGSAPQRTTAPRAAASRTGAAAERPGGP